jgi:ectoine hydroxylase-related dioxygenase (phytanoyl-CoA dioxygenase family)
LTAWIPFQDCDETKGPLVVLDGSHKWPEIQHSRYFSNPDLQAIADQFQEKGNRVHRVSFCLKKGQMSFHHCWTIHGSYPNQSSAPRQALAVHLQDEANHYQPCLSPKGTPVQMIDEALCRKLTNGDPDFSDPAVFPVLWPTSRHLGIPPESLRHEEQERV